MMITNSFACLTMLRQGIPRIIRFRLTAPITSRSSSSKATWSTGEVTHPAPPDCPLGNKGKYPHELPDGGIQYFGFQYYPRYVGEVDPPCDPAPLHLVTRVKSLRGRPYWEKDIMRTFGLDGKKKKEDGKMRKMGNCYTVLKNNPENNAYLWKVKHLIRITPVSIPKDLPDDVDPRCCFLKETGEFIHTPHIRVDDSTLIEDETIAKTKMGGKFIRDHTRKNWLYPWQIKLC